MEHNESHKRDLKVQIREAFGRVVYTYTTHLKQAEFLVKKNKRIRIWQIFLSAISTGGFLGAIASAERGPGTAARFSWSCTPSAGRRTRYPRPGSP